VAEEPRGSGERGPVADDSVHPAWRSALAFVLIWAPWDFSAPAVMAERQARLTRVIDPALVALMPQSAPYLNEANYLMSNVVGETYGPTLERLRQI
jgi:hypothetical protein